METWREFIDGAAHYCPHCPDKPGEAVIAVSDLERHLADLRDRYRIALDTLADL